MVKTEETEDESENMSSPSSSYIDILKDTSCKVNMRLKAIIHFPNFFSVHFVASFAISVFLLQTSEVCKVFIKEEGDETKYLVPGIPPCIKEEVPLAR